MSYSFLQHIINAGAPAESLSEATVGKTVYAVLPKGKHVASKPIVAYKSKRVAEDKLSGYSDESDEIVALNASGAGKMLDATTKKGNKELTDMMLAAGLELDDNMGGAPVTDKYSSGQGWVEYWSVSAVFDPKFAKLLKAAGYSGVINSEAFENFEVIAYGFVGGVVSRDKALVKEGFEDSVDATEFMDKIGSAINDPRLKQWMHDTDTNFDTDTVSKFEDLRDAFEALQAEIDQAA